MASREASGSREGDSNERSVTEKFCAITGKDICGYNYSICLVACIKIDRCYSLNQTIDDTE